MRANIGPQYIDGTDIQQIVPPKWVKLWNGSGSTIPAGSAVQIDVTVTTYGLGSAIKIAAAVAADARKIIGGAVADIPNLSWGLVQVAGVQANVSVITATAADVPLIGSVTTAGRLIVAAFAAGEKQLGLNLAVAASNLSTVLWFNPAGL